MEYLEESGMRFYRDESCWEPEETDKMNHWDHVKSCDLVRKKGKKLYFIEAKTTAPQDDNLHDYLAKIALKFENTLAFFYGLHTGRITEKEAPLPPSMKDENTITQEQHFLILLVREHPKSSLRELQDKLKKVPILKSLLRTLDVQEVLCINADTARKKGFIVSD